MSEVPPSRDPLDDVDESYRRASALDPSRPSEPVRRAVLAYATQLAAERVVKAELAHINVDSVPRAANQPWWRPAVFGTLAAAAIAGFLVLPRLLTPGTKAVPPSKPAAMAPAPAAPPAPTAAAAEPLSASPAPAFAPTPSPPSPPAPVAADVQTPRMAAASGAAVATERKLKQNSPAERRDTTAAQKASAPNAPAAKPDTRLASTNARASSTLEVVVQGSRRQSNDNTSTPMSAAAPDTTIEGGVDIPLAPPEVFRHAAETGDLRKLQVSLDEQVDINSRDDSGRTALLLATLHGQTKAVKMLLGRGADPNAADAQGITPLQAALAGGHAAIVAALKHAGAH